MKDNAMHNRIPAEGHLYNEMMYNSQALIVTTYNKDLLQDHFSRDLNSFFANCNCLQFISLLLHDNEQLERFQEV
jgi:hypothetical protein